MCGISGYWGEMGRGEGTVLVRTMNALLAHRGPDGEGDWIADHVGLGHRRLAIIDLNSGAQPMSTADGRFTIVFNGEIYNYRLLRAELSGVGHRFRTQSDTEVIPAAIEHWGVDKGLLKLRGMFAFALHDRETDSLLLARDRFGIKPLYVGRAPGLVVFGSEPKALLALDGLSRDADPDAILDFFTIGVSLAPATCWAAIRELEPGTWTRLSKDGEQSGRYWRTPSSAHNRSIPEGQALEQLESVLSGSLETHLESDVPLAAFLSGGIDSSVLVALLCGKLVWRLDTFNARFDEKGYDESPYARAVAAHCGSNHHELEISGGEGTAELMEQILGQYDQPFGDSSCLPTYLICREMSRHVKVVMSGDGADELFGGYDRYNTARLLATIGGLAGAPRLVSAVGRMLSGVRPELSRRLQKVSHFSSRPRHEMFCLLHTYFTSEELACLLGPSLLKRIAERETTADRLSLRIPEESPDPAEALMTMELRSILHADYLKKVDVASSAHGLEVRTPYLDAEVADFSSTLPVDLKVRRGSPKHLLRTLASRLLPKEVITRPKQGFGLPLDRWAGTSMHGYFDDLLLGPLSRNRDWLDPGEVRKVLDRFIHGSPSVEMSRYQRYQKLFMLVSFELWLRKWSPSLS